MGQMLLHWDQLLSRSYWKFIRGVEVVKVPFSDKGRLGNDKVASRVIFISLWGPQVLLLEG